MFFKSVNSLAFPHPSPLENNRSNHFTEYQVFGGTTASTSLMLRVYNGSLKRYNSEVLATNIYDKWLHFKVQHDVSTHKISVWINNVLQVTASDNGAPANTNNGYYFKVGVYTFTTAKTKMESRYKNLQILW